MYIYIPTNSVPNIEKNVFLQRVVFDFMTFSLFYVPETDASYTPPDRLNPRARVEVSCSSSGSSPLP